MGIIVNKMDWEKRKKMAYAIEKVQPLYTALLVRVPRPGNTGSTPQPTEEGALGAPLAPGQLPQQRPSAGATPDP